MPIQAVELSPSDLAEVIQSEQDGEHNKPTYIVFYASIVDGRMWCGDCRDAEPFVNKKFGDDSENVRIIYAGKKDEWKNVPNVWKDAPFSISKLPTVLRVQGQDWQRLVEEDVYNQEKLDAFVH